MPHQKKTKIICTIGPASQDEKTIEAMIKAGMNAARFNMSHGTHESHKELIERVRGVADRLGVAIAILLDTKGPEIRTGLLKDHRPVELTEGKTCIITTDETDEGTSERFSVNYPVFAREVKRGTRILIDDGLIGLTVEALTPTEITCRIENGGMLGEKKGVNVPGVELGLPSITETDISDIIFGCEMKVDAIAASFVRNAHVVNEIRALCRSHGAPNISIFAKIECAAALKNFDEILAASDGIMVARGDLAVEIKEERVPHEQKRIIHRCNQAVKPVVTATQMLDSMTHSPRPTRAEICDVANAVYDGTDCVMLSGESASGAYPIDAVETMAQICKETEKFLPEREISEDLDNIDVVSAATGHAAVEMAQRVDARFILTPTRSGLSARLVSNARPRARIIATSPSQECIRRTCFYWGVSSYYVEEQPSKINFIMPHLEAMRDYGLAKPGEIVVATSGDPDTSPSIGSGGYAANVAVIAAIPEKDERD